MTRRRHTSDDALDRLIGEIHEKLDGAAFNGGFESLVQNVQNIEKTQRAMLAKMDEVHVVIYEPDDGLFARVKKVEAIHEKEFNPIRDDVDDLHKWKESLTAKDGLLAQVSEDSRTVKELAGWRKKILAVLAAAAGSTALMVIKTIWEWVSAHVSLH